MFADDSESGDFYTVAGYVAPVSTWYPFSARWYAALKQPPRLGFYRTSDSLALKRQFLGWSRDTRDARVAKLASIIPEAQCHGVAAHLSKKDFRELFVPNFHDAYHDPYFVCADYLIARTCKLLEANARRIDFMFDRQGKVGERFAVVYKAMLKPAYRTRFPFLGDICHENKDRVPPLQAADMHAAWVRRREGLVQIPHVEDCHLSRVPQTDFPVTRIFLEHLANYRHQHEADIRAFEQCIDRGDFDAARKIFEQSQARP
ncbi:MAG TPA: DUF3800 domain-containing protein [Candidatus Acidoferrales bacterium]